MNINEIKNRIPFIESELSKTKLTKLILEENQSEIYRIAFSTKSFENYSDEKLEFGL